jgi:hypothetical protein
MLFLSLAANLKPRDSVVQMLLVLFIVLFMTSNAQKQLKFDTSCESIAQLLSREWQNELGSTMSLQATADGTLKGTYKTKVGNASGWYPLLGRMTCGSAQRPTVAFAVGWQNDQQSSDSSTAWSGQLFEPNRLQTTWLLTRASSEPWASTLTGTNFFMPAAGEQSAPQ